MYYPRNILLSTSRSGSTFLLQSIDALNNPYDDNDYPDKHDFTQPYPDFCLFRFHFDIKVHKKKPKNLLFYEEMDYILQNAKKIIIHTRNTRDIVLSHLIRPYSSQRVTQDYVNSYRVNLVHFKEEYERKQACIRQWVNWIKSTVTTADILYSSWEQMKVLPKQHVRTITDYIGINLDIHNIIDWQETDYSQVANISKVNEML